MSLQDHEGFELCQEMLGYRFRDEDLLRVALTHASVAATRQSSNERLEFLGDAVLGLVVCQYLYERYPNYLEGELTKIKSAVVSRATCAQIARSIDLHRMLYLGKGMGDVSHLPSSVAAAVYEAMIGALYIDGGLDRVRDFILGHTIPHIDQIARTEHQRNYKSQLQQHAQKVLGTTPCYEVMDEKGPDHSKCFEIAVCINGHRFPSAWGTSKKEAEQKAAFTALVDLKILAPDSDAA